MEHVDLFSASLGASCSSMISFSLDSQWALRVRSFSSLFFLPSFLPSMDALIISAQIIDHYYNFTLPVSPPRLVDLVCIMRLNSTKYGVWHEIDDCNDQNLPKDY